MKAFESFLTQCGWERSTWSGNGDDRHYLRADRFTVQLVNDAVGTAGNVTITKVGASITVSGMAGGTVSVKATGVITLTAQPADGNTIVLNDGTNAAVTFEFDSNASVTQTATLRQVVIGSSVDITLDNLEAAITAAPTLAITPTVPRKWRYEGDGLTQHSGLRVRYVSASVRVEISSFVETTAKAALQYETAAALIAYVVYDQTAANDFVLYGGEDGLYCEVGRGGTSQNIAHFMITTMDAIPEFSGTKDATVRWTSQGFVCDLFGNLKFSTNRDYRFVDNQGANRNFTGLLQPGSARGTSSVLIATPVTNQRYYLCNRDNLYGVYYGHAVADFFAAVATLGLGFTPIDGRYKISPLMWVQGLAQEFLCVINSASAANNIAATTSYGRLLEPRWYRACPRFYAVDSSLLPFNNITDQVTSKVLRVAQVADNGRPANIGIEYPPAGDIVTIPTTPTV
ncbi:MAG: hypothetical protein H0X45_02095 [Planctomycetes bacterium]|nr:hypothetical protein [Planctomycetota bacterium]